MLARAAPDKPWNPDDVAAASRKWAYWTSRWLAFRDTVAPRRRVEVDYADLCEGRSSDLSQLVGVELAPYLADYCRQPLVRPAQRSVQTRWLSTRPCLRPEFSATVAPLTNVATS
jgi:hypothetical protein